VALTSGVLNAPDLPLGVARKIAHQKAIGDPEPE
jgi:hypothetical protein